jgi:Uma2 family endonuclease
VVAQLTPPVPAVSAPSTPTPEVHYPDSDGQPMADNTKQFRWITVIQYNLEWLFSKNEQVFVAGDLLWYPVEGNNKIRQAPDVMVAFGRSKGDRGSYQQWKEAGIAPQVVFEILSPGNTLKEMQRKQIFYDRYGVEEYYVYEVIETLVDWVSPRLGICFKPSEPELQLLRPDGTPFRSYSEISQELEQERARADRLAQRLRELGVDPENL